MLIRVKKVISDGTRGPKVS